MTVVAICVLTYLRPTGLARLLGHLDALHVPEGHRFRVIVVDNDPSGSAKPVLEEATPPNLEVHSVVESNRGIAQARNRALAEASGADFIAFIDDDDWPEPDWLERLLRTQAATGADVVLGPTVPVYEGDPPDWIREGRFFEGVRQATGSEVPVWRARTGGVLLRTPILADLGPQPFDPRFGLHGGEDTAFFWELHWRGRRIVWDDEAVIHEVIPAGKSNSRWLLARAFRIGNSRGTHLRYQERGRLALGRRLAGTLRNGARGGWHLVKARSRAEAFRAVQLLVDAAGDALGVFGYRYEEYQGGVRGS